MSGDRGGWHLPRGEKRSAAVAGRRLGLALCASILGHAWLLAAHPGALSGARSTPAVRGVLSAWIAVDSSASAEGGRQDIPDAARVQAVQEEKPAPPTRAVDTRPSDVVVAGPAQKSRSARYLERATTSHPSQLSTPVDGTWYTAQEIDVYPRPAAPLSFAAPQGSRDAVGRTLLWLRIDEHGAVVEVSAGEPGIPAAWLDAARASLTTARFTPARKDERAVRSRLLLGVSFADQRPETRD